MKSIKKVAALAVLALAVAGSAFAVTEDDILSCEFLGSETLEEVAEECSDVEAIYNDFISGLGNGFYVNKFFAITESERDAEDQEVIDFIEYYIDDNTWLEQDDVFMSTVARGIEDGSIDGWIVLSHWSDETYSFTHFMFYFALYYY